MKKILLIDDEPNLTEILTQFLLRLGYTSDIAPSGKDAVELTLNNGYWAVFCDLMMPGMNGLELYDKLRNRDMEQTKRFVLFTGALLDKKTEEKVVRQRITVCRKPFNFENIKATLHSLEKMA